MKAYEHSYGQKVNSDESMLMANVEALTQGEEEKYGYNPTTTPCPPPKSYKSSVSCGRYVLGGEQEECFNSDC